MMTAEKKDTADRLNETGRCAYSAIAEMVAALNCDYDRLAELREMRDDLLTDDNGNNTGADWPEAYPEESDELIELEDAAGDCEDRDDAERRIQEDALSVEVRSAWHTPGNEDGRKPAEFCLLLTTGGPAVRIRGELSEYGEPERAWLEVQDWGTPWTQYFGASQSVLLDYARCFYFGE